MRLRARFVSWPFRVGLDSVCYDESCLGGWQDNLEMTLGQPPDGGLPAGKTSPQASLVPSEAVIVSSCVAARVPACTTEAAPAHASAAETMARTTRNRPTKANASAPLR